MYTKIVYIIQSNKTDITAIIHATGKHNTLQ